MFRLELLPAFHGDCILLSYGSRRNPYRVLIDAGTEPTWENALEKRLESIGTLELFVMTHVDADHIAGAIPFLNCKRDIEIRDVWFNGWKHLPKDLLSSKQGEVFSTLIRDRSIDWNWAFDDEAVMVEDDHLPMAELEGGMRLTVLSPTRQKLGRLARKWKKEIIRHGLRPGDKRRFRQFLAHHPTLTTNVPKLAAMPFKSDGSAPNGSSIALLAEYERKAVLLAGDAHASVLTKSIKLLLAQRRRSRLALDAFKVSHHGSRGNTNEELLSLLACKKFLISCNGDVHNLPDNETIGRIIHFANRPEIVFNYDCERTEAWKKTSLKRRYGYKATYGKEGHYSLDLA